MKTLSWWPPRDFVYLQEGAFAHVNRATIDWVVDKCVEEMTRRESIIAMIYGTATMSKAEGRLRVAFTVNTGGSNLLQLDLMTHFAGNLRETVKKSGTRWFAHLPLRKRLIVRLLMLLAR